MEQFVKCGTVGKLDNVARITNEIIRDGYHIDEINTAGKLVRCSGNAYKDIYETEIDYVIIYSTK